MVKKLDYKTYTPIPQDIVGFEEFKTDDVIERYDISLFPTQIGIHSLPFDYKSMYYNFDKIKKPPYNDPIQATSYGLAAEENYILNQSPFKHLSEVILGCAKKYNDDILNYQVDEWKFTQSWLAYKGNGHMHKKHKHPNSIISGILFFHEEQDTNDVEYFEEICRSMPPTRFFETGRDEHQDLLVPFRDSLDQSTIYNPEGKPEKSNFKYYMYGRFFDVPYIPGNLVLFPSTLYHGVSTNTTNLLRKSLSMNIVPKYGLGDRDTMTEVLF